MPALHMKLNLLCCGGLIGSSAVYVGVECSGTGSCEFGKNMDLSWSSTAPALLQNKKSLKTMGHIVDETATNRRRRKKGAKGSRRKREKERDNAVEEQTMPASEPMGRNQRGNDTKGEDLTAMPLTGVEWSLALGPGSPNYTDMEQGILGDCYLLAAFASIAMKHPYIIRDMFVDGGLATANTSVFTTRWMINGRETLVAVDDQFPTDPETKQPYFARPKDPKRNYWPSIVEKSWAKIFGSYKKIESGRIAEVFKAVTQAPVVHTNHANIQSLSDKSKYWDMLVNATSNNYIMGGTTGTGDCAGRQIMGIYCRHAYSILGAQPFSAEYPQAIKMYNPHGADKYSGKLPNTNKSDGIFFTTFTEFLDGFSSSDVGEVLPSASVTSKVLSTASQRTILLEFVMSSDEPFAVQLEWPSWRLLELGCEKVEPVFLMIVAPKTNLTQSTFVEKSNGMMTNARASMSGKANTYVVAMHTNFPNSQGWLDDFVVNVYGPSTEIAAIEGDVFDTLLEMQGLCKTIMVQGTGLYKGQEACEYTFDQQTEVNGMPIFRGNVNASDHTKKCHTAFAIIYFDAKRQIHKSDHWAELGSNTWKVVDTIENAKGGYYYQHLAVHVSQAACAASLIQKVSTIPKESLAFAKVQLARHAEVPVKSSVGPWYNYEDGTPLEDGFVAPTLLLEYDSKALPGGVAIGDYVTSKISFTHGGQELSVGDRGVVVGPGRGNAEDMGERVEINFGTTQHVNLLPSQFEKDAKEISVTCKERLARLNSLGGGEVGKLIATNGDTVFPAALPSIAISGQSCGDTSTDYLKSCEEDNHWASLKSIRAHVAHVARCKDDCSIDGCITKKVQDNRCLVDFTNCGGALNFTCAEVPANAYYAIETNGRFKLPADTCNMTRCGPIA